MADGIAQRLGCIGGIAHFVPRMRALTEPAGAADCAAGGLGRPSQRRRGRSQRQPTLEKSDDPGGKHNGGKQYHNGIQLHRAPQRSERCCGGTCRLCKLPAHATRQGGCRAGWGFGLLYLRGLTIARRNPARASRSASTDGFSAARSQSVTGRTELAREAALGASEASFAEAIRAP